MLTVFLVALLFRTRQKKATIRSTAVVVWPWIASGEFRPVVDSRFSFANAADAHRGMESSAHVGKIVLVP